MFRTSRWISVKNPLRGAIYNQKEERHAPSGWRLDASTILHAHHIRFETRLTHFFSMRLGESGTWADEFAPNLTRGPARSCRDGLLLAEGLSGMVRSDVE